MAEEVDATVSKTVGGQPPCRFESDLRHQRIKKSKKVPAKGKVFADGSAGLCSGSTEDFGSFSPGSNPGPAAKLKGETPKPWQAFRSRKGN